MHMAEMAFGNGILILLRKIDKSILESSQKMNHLIWIYIIFMFLESELRLSGIMLRIILSSNT